MEGGRVLVRFVTAIGSRTVEKINIQKEASRRCTDDLPDCRGD